MSVAFPAVFLFVLVLPGIILHYTYSRGPWKWGNPTSLGSLADEVAYSVAFAVGLHLCWVSLVEWLGYQVDLGAVLILLLGAYGEKSVYLPRAIAAVADHSVAISFYFLTLYILAAIVGCVGHIVVRAGKWDRKTTVFRFKNDWYYLLTGEVLEFADNPVAYREFDGVYLSAVVETGNRSYLYRGIVTDFTFDRTGGLDRIVLRDAHRRELEDDVPDPHVYPSSKLDSRYHLIRGDFFVLRYSEIKTMNLDYFALELESEQEAVSGK